MMIETSPDADTGEVSDSRSIGASLASPERFAEIFDRHWAEIYRYIARRLGPDHVLDQLEADLVKAEDARRPLSDQKIVELLEEKGIQLARRTVAKYREQLQILPSSKRKKYF